MRLTLIAALGRNRGIGKDGQLLWRIPDDLKRFKELTLGRPVIVGRKTWESIPEKFRPLPGRTNIVLSHQHLYHARGAVVFNHFRSAYAFAAQEGGDETFVIGGEAIYHDALGFADRLCLTLIDGEKESDAFFPFYEHLFTRVIFEERREWSGLRYTWIDLERTV